MSNRLINNVVMSSTITKQLSEVRKALMHNKRLSTVLFDKTKRRRRKVKQQVKDKTSGTTVSQQQSSLSSLDRIVQTQQN